MPDPDLQGTALRHAAGATIHLLPGAFNDVAHACDLALAMAGTATEQLVGLGKPVISLPGGGPQFTPAFAEAQTRLLGPAVSLRTGDASDTARFAWQLLADEPRRVQITADGRQRMGPPGAANRIACALAALL